MSVRFALVLLGSLAVVGCATDGTTTGGGAPAPVAAAGGQGAAEAFRRTDFAWSTAAGKGEIDGQLAFKQGSVAYGCADAGVLLTPETPWVRRRMQILYTSADKAALPAAEVRARTPPERNQDYSGFVKRATCDAAGHFTFAALPDGAWYVITVARPVAPASGADMAIMRRVVVKGGKIKLTL
ncbi:MAG: hypothetical protein ACXU82_00525 [Caulobacteraceae bacterium]